MADAKPFHWEYQPEPVAREVFRVEGGQPLSGDRADQRRQERRAQAAGRRDPDRRALPVHQRPRDRGRAGHGRDAARPRRRRRSPGRQRLRGRLGRRRVAVRPARGGRPDARQLHAARAAPDPVRAGHHQQPGRRPDRPAAGRPPRRGDARARRLDRVPQRLLLRDRRPGGCAAARSASRSCRSWAPRTRCSRRPSPRATRSSGRPPRSPRSTTSSRSSRRWAPRSSGPSPTPSRSRVASACAAPSTGSSPTGSRPARSSSPPR